MTKAQQLDWRFLRDHAERDYEVFHVFRREAEHPLTGAAHTFSILRADDWVNVIALTPADELLLVRQYRHGVGRQTLEVPGGIIDPGETPEQAARRELREETGHRADRWLDLGYVEPNPAFMTNRCHTWLALDARPVGELQPDAGEALALERAPLASVDALVRAGEITHSLVIAAFYQFTSHAGGWRRPPEP
ncbi:NUDIX hydrolase [Haliangium ochraceum]|uniref:GDP-mannose pyrophosphatase n=1 Tax=Haliangium ochraceum (strain DSM 14365 / JCM 11303 / SMP-2) TaxID=502025 RepID=D0LIK1_HALO1|nr:NUDIX hydrolase [Haliangium ochraceum]ACY18357.1 NUDIX hydrolase [Haliangium ochraceum DSM 14365]